MREGWIQKRFDEVFDLQMGKTPDRKNYDFFEGDNVWVSIRDLTSKEISDSNEHISDNAVKSTNIKKVSKGTVIMSFKLTVGKCAIAAKDLYTNEAIMAFNLKEGYSIDSSFLYYYLQGYKWEGANKAVMGMTLNKATISKHYVSIPPKSHQEAIVSELDEINSLLELKREQLQKYDKLAQSLFYEMFGDPVENEKGWEVKKVSNVCSVFGRIGFRGYTKADFVESPEEGAISLSPTNIINNSMDYKKCSYVTWDKYHESPEIKARIGDILLVKTGSSYGKCALITCLPHKATINPQFVIIKNITINNRYLHYYLSSEAAKICYDNFVIGTAVPTFSQKNLNNMAVLVPPLSLQQQFASRIEQIESQKQQVQAAIENLETLLASRMQYWFD